MTIKELAKKQLIKNGLPSNRVEKWHYTSLNKFLSYLLENKFADLNTLGNIAAWKAKNVDLKPLPLATDISETDVVQQINIAGFTGGACFVVDKNINWIDLENTISAQQHHTGLAIKIDENVQSNIIEKHIVNKGKLASSITRLNLANGSCVNYIILNTSNVPINSLQQFNAVIGADATLNLFIINMGCNNNLIRQEINVQLIDEKANFNLRAINLLSDNSHTDIEMVIEHNAPHTTSNEILRNIVLDKAFGAFQGIIKVARIAQKTEGKMSCNTLLLSDDASFSAKPELEIFADDVICGHGATVAPINDDLLFYLLSRGINANTAKSLLIKAFISELIENQDILDRLTDVIEGWISTFIEKNE